VTRQAIDDAAMGAREHRVPWRERGELVWIPPLVVPGTRRLRLVGYDGAAELPGWLRDELDEATRA
jgi:hypothetical protein